MADRYLLESGAPDGYLLEDGSGVLLLETPAVAPDLPLAPTSSLPPTTRRASRAIFACSLAFVALVPSADAAPAVQGDDQPLSTVILQYASLTAPVFVPPAGGETITLDKWVSQPPGAPRRVVAVPPSGATAPIFVPDVTQPVTPLQWLPRVDTPVRLAPTGRPGLSVGPVEPPAAAPAAPELLAPLPGIAPRRVVLGPQPGAVAPLYVPDVTVVAPALSWQPVGLGLPARAVRVLATPSAAPVAPVVVAPTTPDLTPVQVVGAPQQSTWRGGQAVTAPVYVPDVTDPAPLLLSPQPSIAPRRVLLPPQSGGVRSLEFPPDVVSADASPAQQGGDQPFGDVVVPYASVTGPVFVPPSGAETITVDKWLNQPPQAPRRVVLAPLVAAVAPVFVPDVTQPVTPLSWRPAEVRRPGQPRRAVPSGAVGPVAPVVAATTPYAEAVNSRVVPRRVGPRGLIAVVAPVYVPGVTVPVPPGLPWGPVYPPRAFHARRHPAVRWWLVEPVLGVDPSLFPAPPAPVGNLWEDITQTPGATPYGAPVAGTGTSPFGAPAPGVGASPFDTVTPGSGTSPFGSPPTPRGKSPWDLP